MGFGPRVVVCVVRARAKVSAVWVAGVGQLMSLVGTTGLRVVWSIREEGLKTGECG